MTALARNVVSTIVAVLTTSSVAIGFIAQSHAWAAPFEMGAIGGRGVQFQGAGAPAGHGLGGMGPSFGVLGMNRGIGNGSIGAGNFARGSSSIAIVGAANNTAGVTRPGKGLSPFTTNQPIAISKSTSGHLSTNSTNQTMGTITNTLPNLRGVAAEIGRPAQTQVIGDDPKPGKTGEREKEKPKKGCSWRIVDITITSYEKEEKKDKEDEWWKKFIEKAVEKAKTFVADHAGKQWDTWFKAVEENVSIFKAKAVFLTYACVDEDGAVVDVKVVKLEDEDALYWWTSSSDSKVEQTKIIEKQRQRLATAKTQPEAKK